MAKYGSRLTSHRLSGWLLQYYPDGVTLSRVTGRPSNSPPPKPAHNQPTFCCTGGMARMGYGARLAPRHHYQKSRF